MHSDLGSGYCAPKVGNNESAQVLEELEKMVHILSCSGVK